MGDTQGQRLNVPNTRSPRRRFACSSHADQACASTIRPPTRDQPAFAHSFSPAPADPTSPRVRLVALNTKTWIVGCRPARQLVPVNQELLPLLWRPRASCSAPSNHIHSRRRPNPRNLCSTPPSPRNAHRRSLRSLPTVCWPPPDRMEVSSRSHDHVARARSAPR